MAGLNGTQRPDIITVRIEKGCKIYDIYEYDSPSQKTGTKRYNDLVNKFGTIKKNNPKMKINFHLIEWGKY